MGRAAFPQRFGAAHLIEIVRGTGADKIARLGRDRIPTFGVGVERGKNEWRSLMRQMAEMLERHVTVAAPMGRGGGRMRLKRPRPASPDQMRIIREGETAVMEYAEPSIRVVTLPSTASSN